MKLVIVESPNKTKSISQYLGDGYRVEASVGHIRDLPPHELGVAPPDFKPRYEVLPDKKAKVGYLRKLADAAEEIFLATDPDREGEAISWHLFQALRLAGKRVKRIRFHEISQRAIQEAVSSPGDIDKALVAAQEARRVIDRLVGYEISPRLGGGHSAGRVQTPGLRLVVEREWEIRNFRPIDHYQVIAAVDGWKARWDFSAFLDPGQRYFQDRQVAAAVAETRTLTVLDIERGRRRRPPPPPFTTSTLQQAASARLGFAPEKTMELAQSLFAQGLISYHRTDSPNLSREATQAVRDHLAAAGHPLPEKPNTWRARGNAQEAHEAIRPTDIALESAGANDDEARLYRLIRARTLACQMEDAVYDTLSVRLEGDVRVPMGDRPLATFVHESASLTDQRGWLALYDDEQGQEGNGQETDEDMGVCADAAPGRRYDCECRLETRKTKPPARYTEASLIKTLERLGIGRPSTYAAILANLKKRGYVRVEKKTLTPTEKGEDVYKRLRSYKLSILDYEYTKNMENGLDRIAAREIGYVDFVRAFYDGFSKELATMPEKQERRRPVGEDTGATCRCGTAIERFDNRYSCPACRKVVWRTMAGREISLDEAVRLLAGETLRLSGFVSREGKSFEADVRIDPRKGAAGFVFERNRRGRREGQKKGARTGGRRRKD